MKTFIKNLEHNWMLFKLDDLSSKNYFETYQKNKELNFLHQKNKTNHPNISNNIYANEIIYGNLKKKKWTFIDLKDFKYYSVFNIVMLPGPIIIFFFNIDDPCFIIQNYCYMDFFYFGRIKKKALIEISSSTSGNFRQLPIIEKNLNLIYNIGLNTKIPVIFNKTILFFGFINNVGHYLWNELSGLFYFLNETKNISLIDSVAIGPYDFFNIKKYLSDTYKLKTINFNVEEYPLYFNIYPVYFNSVFIDNVNIKPLKSFMNIDTNKNILDNSNNLQIVLDVRTKRRVIINIIELYTFIIETLYKEIPSRYKLNIVFTGRFLTNLNDINIVTDQEIIEQNLIVRKIISKFTNSNILFNNLIGKSFENIIKNIHKSDLMIVIFGTSAPNLINWICNTKTIGFVQPFHYSTYTSTQSLCINNVTCFDIPSNCFKMVDENLDCIIDLPKFYEYFYNIFIKLL
jgi:hypothetical protein